MAWNEDKETREAGRLENAPPLAREVWRVRDDRVLEHDVAGVAKEVEW